MIFRSCSVMAARRWSKGNDRVSATANADNSRRGNASIHTYRVVNTAAVCTRLGRSIHGAGG